MSQSLQQGFAKAHVRSSPRRAWRTRAQTQPLCRLPESAGPLEARLESRLYVTRQHKACGKGSSRVSFWSAKEPVKARMYRAGSAPLFFASSMFGG